MRHLPRASVLIVVAIAAMLAACSKSTPTTPTPEPSLVFAPLSSPLFLRATQQATLIQDSLPVAHLATWLSDAPAIASVGPTGIVTGVSSGTTTIRATYDGRSRSSTVRIVPNYAVEFSYTATVTECAITSGNAVCGPIVGAATTGTLFFGQSATTVTFKIDIGDGRFQAIQCPIADDGSIEFSASGVVDGVSHTESWHLNSPDGLTLVGTRRDDFTTPTYSGYFTGTVTGTVLR